MGNLLLAFSHPMWIQVAIMKSCPPKNTMKSNRKVHLLIGWLIEFIGIHRASFTQEKDSYVHLIHFFFSPAPICSKPFLARRQVERHSARRLLPPSSARRSVCSILGGKEGTRSSLPPVSAIFCAVTRFLSLSLSSLFSVVYRTSFILLSFSRLFSENIW